MIIGFCVDNNGLGKPVKYHIKTVGNNKKHIESIKYSKLMCDNEGITPYELIEIDTNTSDDKIEEVIKNNNTDNV